MAEAMQIKHEERYFIGFLGGLIFMAFEGII